MKMALLITFSFLVLLLLSFFVFSLLTAIRKAEFEDVIIPTRTEKTKQEE